MFTGIIEAIGEIDGVERRGGDLRLKIHTGKLDMSDVGLGDSIAVNGVCLTAVELEEAAFVADVSRETLAATTLCMVNVGLPVNLEKALLPTTRLGGHLVSGHVDGVGVVKSREEDARSVRFRVEVPSDLARYLAAKGSVCVNGISLTVTDVSGSEFGLNIVPHTLQETSLGTTHVGDSVNIEVDVIARYLESLLGAQQITSGTTPQEGEPQDLLTKDMLTNLIDPRDLL